MRIFAIFSSLAFLVVSTAFAATGVLGGWGDFYPYSPVTISNVLAISAGVNTNEVGFGMALTTNGTILEFDRDGRWLTNQSAALTGITRISAGFNDYRLALRNDGTVTLWSPNGLPTMLVPPTNLTGVAEISMGGNHALALKSNGLVVAWGSTNYYQTNVPAGLSNVVAVSAGLFHSVALRANGTVVSWGMTNYGQCDVPPGLDGVRAIAAGDYHTSALRTNGTVVVWGANYRGNTAYPLEAYAVTNVPPSLSNVVAISGGRYYNLALKADGTVVGWGRDAYRESSGASGQTGIQLIAAGKSFYYSFSLAVGPGPFFTRFLYDGSNVNLTNPAVALERANLTLTPRFVSQSPPVFQWLFNGLPIPGATSSLLVLANLQYLNSGNYSLTLSNGAKTFGTQMGPCRLWIYAGNDTFANAKALLPVGGRVSDYLSASLLAREAEEPLHAGAPSGKTIWYTWTAPADGTVNLDTEGSNFDTVLAVYTGNALASLAPVATDDDGGTPVPPQPNVTSPGRRSKLHFTAIKGVNYKIAVASYGLTLPATEATAQLNLAMDQPVLSASLGSASLAISVGAPLGSIIVIESSSDLKAWFPVLTNRVSAEALEPITFSVQTGQARQFFRTARY